MKSTTTDALYYHLHKQLRDLSKYLKENTYAIKVLEIHTELSDALASQGQVI